MTKQQIIKETVEYYRNNKRSIKNGMCVYLDDKGNKCAFSRCCTKAGVAILKEKNSFSVKKFPNHEALLLKKYKGHSKEFWIDVQHLHDNGDNWRGQQLTKAGNRQMAYLLEKYA